jgi:hypothetical protein
VIRDQTLLSKEKVGSYLLIYLGRLQGKFLLKIKIILWDSVQTKTREELNA